MERHLNLIDEAKRIRSESGLPTLAARVFNFARKETTLASYRVLDTLARRRQPTLRDVCYSGRYRIKHQHDEVDPYFLRFDFDSPHRRHRIDGEYEPAVAEALVDVCDPDTTYWEVGAAWGYHSMALAPEINQAVCFEPDFERLSRLVKSVDDNGYANVKPVAEAVESLDDYSSRYCPPDVLLMDIDGGEFDVIPNSPNVLESGCTWIVEVHHDHGNPQELESLFKAYGYELNQISQRQKRTHFGRELDEINVHHILAVGDEVGGVGE